MPEGHTLHRLARDMAELIGPEISATSPQGRFRAEAVDGARLTGVEAHGKHLLLEVDGGDYHCTDCGTRVVIGVIDGRTTYTCPRCQPEWEG